MSKQLLPSTKSGPMFLVALANGFFICSMLLWMIFLWNGALLNNVVVPLPLGKNRITSSNEVAKLGFDTVLSITFFIQHSTMIRKPFRLFLAKFVAAEYHGVIYTITSGVVLSMVIIFWQKSTYIIAAPSSIAIRLLMRAMFVLALQGLRWAAQSLKSFDVCGVDPILRKIGQKEPHTSPMPLSMSGPYRYVRHPFYFFCLVLFWSCPNLTMDRLLYNVLWSVWVVIGTLLEERDLVLEFGEPYREYQCKVPMLIPWLIRSEKTKAKPNALEKKSY